MMTPPVSGRHLSNLITVNKNKARAEETGEGLLGHLTKTSSQSGLSWWYSVRTPLAQCQAGYSSVTSFFVWIMD